MPLAPGTRLGNYQVLAPLGAGGMGEVYRARDSRLGREIAIKVLPSDVDRDAGRLARLEREARVVASLNHPNIVTLYSIEDADGVRFLTMELVEGETLDRHRIRGGMPAERVAELGLALAEALVAAHARGVIHRDLKPGNVMLARDGRLKVLDFGLARPAMTRQALDLTRATTVEGPLTVAGELVGTLPYMAPEQLRGEPLDARTDLFALGIVLFELLTGRRPFEGSTPATLSSAILRDPPPPISSLRPDAPAHLVTLITRCLEKEPSRRFASAAEVASALRAVTVTPAGGGIYKPPPASSTPLLGRDALLDVAIARIADGARLLTITGYGGTGKTRFSMALYQRLAASHPGGAAFVSLAGVTAADEVMPTVATALDIGEAHGRTPLEALCAVIADQRMLLVLDNLEQVIDAAGEVATLVSRCPALQVVATSRAPLKVGAETEFALPPLELPEPDARTPEAIASCPSVMLFLQRADKVKPGFTLTAANAGAIAAICRQLDGLPLALELAAARVRILEPAALLQRLDRALDLLTTGDRDLPLRQRTLRTTISWSYSLLTPDEQRLLRGLSVFREGWTFEAMERVCYPPGGEGPALDELASLVEKGLVRVVGEGERYTLLETIRAFASEQLHAGGETDALEEAHARYFVTVALAIRDDLAGPGQIDAMRRGRAELANLHAALQWLTARARAGDAEAREHALLLAGGMDWYWHITGLHLTAREWLDAVLALAAGAPPSRGRALAGLAAGMVSTCTGEWERSLGEWTRAFEDASAIGDAPATAEGRMGMGYCLLSLRRVEEAAVVLDDAIARCTGVTDFILGLATALKGMLCFATGNLDDGIAIMEHAIRIEARISDYEIRGVATSFLAQMMFSKGDHARALALYREGLRQLETVGDLPEIARVHSEVGWTALAGNDTSAARRAFQDAVRTNEVVGSPRGTGLALLGLAAVEAAEGRTARAVEIAAYAEALSQRAGVVIAHPMAPGLAERIEALKATIPRGELDDLVAAASTLTPAAVLAMVGE